jgi:hypothetical protein
MPAPFLAQAAAVRRGSEWRFLSLVAAGGLAIRLIWLWRVHGRVLDFLSGAEAGRAALSVARHGIVGDAYFIGQGASAHLLPINPMISGGLLWAFGPGSTGANLALLIWSLAQVTAGYLLVRALFAELDANPFVLRWGTALLFLAIPFVPQETIEFRYWEGGSALCLAALNLLLAVRLDKRGTLDRGMLPIVAGLSAITFFVSPVVGLAVDLCWAVVALRRLPFVRACWFGIASALALALLIAPWAIRNERMLGEPVLLRSNFGLELAMANHQAALDSPLPPAYVFDDRFHQIHPSDPEAGLRPLMKQRGGEVRYSRMLARRTEAWIAAHPAGFARLCLRHLREFFLPEAWQMYFTGWEGMRTPRALAIAAVDLAGLAGLLLGSFGDRRRYWMPLLYVFAVALPYSLFQPIARYTYLVYPILAFAAIETIFRARMKWARR